MSGGLLPSGNPVSAWFSSLHSRYTATKDTSEVDTYTGNDKRTCANDGEDSLPEEQGERRETVSKSATASAIVPPGKQNQPHEDENEDEREQEEDEEEQEYAHVHKAQVDEEQRRMTEEDEEALRSSMLQTPELPWRQTHELFRHIGDKVSSLGEKMRESVKAVVLGARQYDALSILTSELLPMLEQEAGDKSRIDILTSLRQLHQHNDQFQPDESILLGLNLNGKRDELLERARNLHHFGHFAVASYGWRGALFSRVFRSTLQKHEWTRFKNVLGNAMGTDKDFFARLTGIKHDDILFESKEHPTYGLPKHWLVVDHAHQALVLSIRGTATAADALTDAVSRNKGFINGSEAHEGFAVSAHALYASMFSSEGLWLHTWLSRFKGYKLVICGHSLGGGVAILLCALIYHFRNLHVSALGSEHARDVPLYGVKVTCYAYGPPPVMSPVSKFPEEAVKNTFIFVNGEDCVPRMSLRSVRDLVKLLSFLCDHLKRDDIQAEGDTSPLSLFDRVITSSALCDMERSTNDKSEEHLSTESAATTLTPLQIPGSKIYLKLSSPLRGITTEDEMQEEQHEATSEETVEAKLGNEPEALPSNNTYGAQWAKHKEHMHYTLNSISKWWQSISNRRFSTPGADGADQSARTPDTDTVESISSNDFGSDQGARTTATERANLISSRDFVQDKTTHSPAAGSNQSPSYSDEGLSLGRDVTKFLDSDSDYQFAWLSEPSEEDFPELIVRTCAIQEHMPFSYLEALFQLQRIIETACTL